MDTVAKRELENKSELVHSYLAIVRSSVAQRFGLAIGYSGHWSRLIGKLEPLALCSSCAAARVKLTCSGALGIVVLLVQPAEASLLGLTTSRKRRLKPRLAPVGHDLYKILSTVLVFYYYI